MTYVLTSEVKDMNNPNYSKEALSDLDNIYSNVLEASKDHDTANKYINDLLDTLEAKSNIPKTGTPLYYDGLFSGYYYVVFKAYIAFYYVENDTIFVDRILSGKSDYLRVLFP